MSAKKFKVGDKVRVRKGLARNATGGLRPSKEEIININ
jgi:hypothetical protein